MILSIRAATLQDALEALSEEIAKREAAGERNYIFCEDRLTLLAERAVLKKSGGTFLSEVTTFARYLKSEKPVLSKEGSVMKISELILKRKGDGCFTGGSARAVYETIAQLSASRVDEGALLLAAESTDGTLKRKLSDLAYLLKEYNEFLNENGLIDENGYLSLLPDKIADGNLEDANVFFFAFPSFTRQALEGVRAAFLHAKSVTGIFLGGKESLYTEHALNAFLRTAEECGMTSSKKQAPTLLCNEGKAIIEGVYAPVSDAPMRTEKISIFEAQDETEEFERIAALIKKHISEGERYFRIGVLVPGADYFPTAEKVFSQYKIPFYLDRKRALSEHPFAGYVLSVLEGVSDGLLPEEADKIAANVCFGEADEYRNYLLRYGQYRGAAKREIKKQEEIREFKRENLVPFSDKMRAVIKLFPGRAKGAAFVKAVRTLFTETDWEGVLQKLKEDAGETGDGFSPAEENFLSLGMTSEDAFGKTLLEIERVAGEREFTVREFAALLKSGLDANEVLLVPPSLDAVFVGDATECLFAATPVLFAAGLTEKLPVVSEDTAIISDQEIKRLSEIRVEIAPAMGEVNARMRESFALNLASFTKRLYMSRPVKLHGEETQRSEALIFAEKRFLPAPVPEVFPYDCSERTPAALRMLREKESFLKGDSDKKALRYNAIRMALEHYGVDTDGGEKRTSSPLASLLWLKSESVSPTLLESYFECPYEGFMTRALKLTERREGSLAQADAGIFVHAVLERTAKSFNDIKTVEELEEKVRAVAEGLLSEPRFLPLLDTREGQYARERLLSECLVATRAAWRQLVNSKFRVTNTEKNISIPALKISGTADRVDEADELVRVIDYKTGYLDDSPTAYYTGRKLQLELYLLAASEGKTPAGAFYFPAADSFTKEGGGTRFSMKGFYNAEDSVITKFDTTLQEGEKSELFDGARKEIKENGKGMAEGDFCDFLEYGYYVSEQAEAEMKEGNFAPSPYDDACDRCRLKSLCAFTGEPRKESDLNCGEITRIVREKKGG
ncbi:MAG: PD-(D/E)XK nuclease family protein [Clostridia bacterium]|nr:PD-(D/E)XK nuclease family protein [Clostridia bacterium]